MVWVSGLYKIAMFFVRMGTAEASQGKSSGLMKMAMLAATLVVATWFIGGAGIGTMQSLLDKVTGTIEGKVAEAPPADILGTCVNSKTVQALQTCLDKEPPPSTPPASTTPATSVTPSTQ